MTIDVVWDGKAYACELVGDAPPTPEPLRVVAYSQNDPRWRNEVYASRLTFGQAGCLVVSVAMIASLAYAEAPLPPDVARELRRVGAFSGDMLAHPARIPQAYNQLEWGGAIHWRTRAADINFLKAEIDRYGGAICEVKWNPNGASPEQNNQHFIVVEGIAGNDALIVDPWTGERGLLSATRYRLSGWDAARTLYGIRLVRPKA